MSDQVMTISLAELDRRIIEAKVAGFRDGYDYGKAKYTEGGYDEGRTEGYEEGRSEGYDEGYDEGYEAGVDEVLSSI